MKEQLTGKRIGICCKKGLGWKHLIHSIDGMGFEHVELGIPGSDPDSPMFDTFYLQQIRALAEERELPLSVHSPMGTNLAEKVNRIREVSVQIVCEAVKTAETIGARWVTVHLGSAGFSNGESAQKSRRMEIVASAVREILQRTEGSPVLLGLENLPCNPAELGFCRMGDRGEELRYVLDQVSSDRLGVIIDLAHARITAHDTAFRELVAAVRERILGFHVHWNDRRTDTHSAIPREAREELEGYLETIRELVTADAPLLLESYKLEDNLTSLHVLRGTL
jgi:sugar phosphate isomerase/epimerase